MSIMRVNVPPGSILEAVLRKENIPVETGKDIEIDADKFSLNHEAEKRACLDQSDEEIRARAIARTVHGHELESAAQWGNPLTVFNTEIKATRATMYNAAEEVKREIRDTTRYFGEYFRALAEKHCKSLLSQLVLLFLLMAVADILLIGIFIVSLGARH